MSFRNGIIQNPIATDGFSITPNDSTALTNIAVGIYVGGAGDLKVDTKAGTALTFVGVAAGTFLPIAVTKVYATGTTATNIIGLR